MKLYSILVSLFFLSSVQAADWIVPRIEIMVIDENTGKPAPGVTVTVGVRKKWFGDVRILEETVTGRSGAAQTKEQRTDKFGYLGLGFRWTEPNLPPREMFVEVGAKKGRKSHGARKIKIKGVDGGYVIDGETGGKCGNLFEVTGDGGLLRIVFRKPRNYLSCEKAGNELFDINSIGSRNINAKNLNLYKFDDDVRMGGEFFKQIEQTKENPPLEDRQVNNYVKNMVGRIAKASDMPDLDFKVTVIDADVVNAFAVPGGYIFVYRGLIESTETEAELAGVIAHEIAHVTSRHGTEGVTSAISKTTLAMVAAEVASSQLKDQKEMVRNLAQTAIAGGTQFWVVGGTRKREAEADQLGVQYAWRAGYDPNGIATLFSRWAEKKGKPQTRLDEFFSDHPNDLTRVANVQREMGYFLPYKEGLIVSSNDYVSVKNRLKQLPPPKVSGETAGAALFSSFKTVNETILLNEIEGHLVSEKKE